ncbi:hypothetical protein [Nocardia transvalensis]|nr:hypothetical protein [Nocardia transvalensis]MBF6332277.1 hypothetical protein [Nocardia transvalensis]
MTDTFMELARVEGRANTRRDQHGTVSAELSPEPGDVAAPEIDCGQL